MRDYLSNLASKCQGIAGVICDGERVQKECPENLKSVLLEASHALDCQSVKVVYQSKGNVEVVNSRGKHRKLTIRERLAICILGGRMEIRP